MKTSSNIFVNMKFFIFLFYLALLSMLGFIATDMYLPAFKAIESSFNSSPSQVAMSLTCFLAGLACTGFGGWLFVGATQAYSAAEPEVIACPQADATQADADTVKHAH